MTATENEVRIDRQRYLFECMLRSPDFQKDLSDFVRKYPVFFRFQKQMLASYGTVEKLARELWEILLEESSQKLQKIDETDESIIYKYVLNNARQSVELEEWENKIKRSEIRLRMAARTLHGENPNGPVLVRIFWDRTPSPYGLPSFLSAFQLSADYLALATCSADDFSLAEMRFIAQWAVHPHHVRMQRGTTVLLREDLERFDSSFKLFIPVSSMTTKDDIERSWVEIAEAQKAVYGKKRRPGRTFYEGLLKIYDLCCKHPPDVVAKQIGISKSAVEKQYRRVYRDVRGVAGPGRKPKSAYKQKARIAFDSIVDKSASNESPSGLLRRVCVEQKIPLWKVDKAETLPDFGKMLTVEEYGRLRDGLIASEQERQRKKGLAARQITSHIEDERRESHVSVKRRTKQRRGSSR